MIDTPRPSEDDALARIERVLRDAIGLDPSTVGRALVRRAAERRRAARGLADLDAYAAAVARDGSELQELVEEVVVPETYFFREREALDALVALVRAGTLRATAEAPLRVLSAPCSTGEEPYSIAMALLGAGVEGAAIAVDGIDVSREAVKRAREAVYRGGSFRGDTSGWRHWFAEPMDGARALRDEVKRLVRIERGNVLAPDFRAPRETYDVVFCRNLLIYFDVDAQARVMETVTRLLAPGGVLFVGAADTFAVRRAGFVPLGRDLAFAYRLPPGGAVAAPSTSAAVAWGPPPDMNDGRAPARSRHRSSAHRTIRDGRTTGTRSGDPGSGVREPRAPFPDPRPPIPDPRPFAPRSSPTDARASIGIALADIARLADGGRLDEAARLGEELLARPDLAAGAGAADLLALLGTAYDARGDAARAERCYRRALYLDPTHPEALLHLALLVEARGDGAGAARLRDRARRGRAMRGDA